MALNELLKGFNIHLWAKYTMDLLIIKWDKLHVLLYIIKSIALHTSIYIC